ncbi:hypothetical protein [Aliarcobacter skirrowii]|uniref:hypothetical protein n=1 Tax=Aliarcobacter skirrowii TaxID=28200 RepID=UPI0029B81E0F|nr:hypothetical protein [Aliarcobacter skirrowii]MDX4036786.1 hypothetical protein [Aliarcobacter skirrowii]
MEKKKILIMQSVLLHYRKAVYNELAKYYDITILHFDYNKKIRSYTPLKSMDDIANNILKIIRGESV